MFTVGLAVLFARMFYVLPSFSSPRRRASRVPPLPAALTCKVCARRPRCAPSHSRLGQSLPFIYALHHDCAMPRSQHLAPDTALPLARTSRPPPVFRGAAPPATAPLALRTHCALRGVHFFRDCTSTIDGTSEVHLRDGTSMHHPPRVTARRGVLFVLRGARSARGWTRISAGYVCRENVFRFSRERE